MAAEGSALQVWQPRVLRCRCGSRGCCAAGVAAERLHRRLEGKAVGCELRQPRVPHYTCGSHWGTRGCTEGVAAHRAALQ